MSNEGKATGEINFSDIFHLTQLPQIPSFQQVVSIKITNVIFTLLKIQKASKSQCAFTLRARLNAGESYFKLSVATCG